MNLILHHLFPRVSCIFCEKEIEEGDICEDCKFEEIDQGSVCSLCGYPLDERVIGELSRYYHKCKECQESVREFALHRSYAFYDGTAKKSLFSLKYHGQIYLSEVIAEKLAMLYYSTENLRGVDLVCSVPSHFFRRLIRGYDQAKEISVEFSKKVGIKYEKILARQKFTRRLHKLGREDRIVAMKNAIMVNRPLNDQTVLLIDDIYTTGTTLDTCAKALCEAGAKEIKCLTFAMRRRDNATYQL